MVQTFTFFEHMQIVRMLEPIKIFTGDYNITQFFFKQQLFVYYGTPDVPVYMVASYHRLDGEKTCNISRKSLN